MSIRKGNDIIASTPAVDTVPQQGSANVITSGGVYTVLQDYVTLSTPQTITANKVFNGAKISTNSDIEFTSAVAGLVSNRNGTIRNLITRTSFNEVNVGNPYDPTIILGSGVRPHYNTIEYLALYSDIPGDFTGATSVDSGTNGLVPAPAAGDQGKFLQGDGTWATPTAATAWGNITGTLSSQTDLQNALDAKANVDMDNLTSTGQNIVNWSSNVSNCITEIPQDIKLELNNGTLTLKAGSKVYVPNGFEADGVTPKFDVITIASDLTNSDSGNTRFMFYDVTNNEFRSREVTNSGTSDPATPATAYYDTGNNIINYYTMAGVKSTVSFPICIVSGNPGVASIDQVFNGFGYIGSTLFALPGVKGLIPNGRNDDGTLKSTPFEVENVLISGLFTGSWSGGVYIKSDRIIWTNTTVYNEAQNITIDSANYITAGTYCLLGYHTTTNGKVVLRPKSVFHAFDYDTEFIGHQSKPNNKCVDITYGANGAVYLMPADGYLCVGVTHPDNSNWEAIGIDVLDANNNFLFNVGGTYNLNNQPYWFLVPVSKNFKVQIWINGFSFNRLRFIYANGSV